MLKLCGIPFSNYYNKVKFVLLEKGVPFEELVCFPSQDDGLLVCSPLGKVPYIETEQGMLSESSAIIDYLEAAYPRHPLLPADPFAAAKQRELSIFLDLYLDLVARETYGAAFFGAPAPSDETMARVGKALERDIAGLKRLGKFSPYLCGAEFGLADISAYVHLSLVANTTQRIFGHDMVADGGIDWKAHAQRVGERPAAQRVTAERRAFVEARKKSG